jgi:hypothetical protein
MKFILHIGMGKTGTSSLQKALADNEQRLRTQAARYLGMWFDMLDDKYRGLQNQTRFFALNPAEVTEAGEHLYAHLLSLSKSDGVETSIMSNEASSRQAAHFKPLLQVLLARGVTVQVICYLRNPADWLPSAYVQWGVRHKMEPGRVQPYRTKARKLVNWYSGPVQWHEQVPDILALRSYDATNDVVEDFASAAGVSLDPPGVRVLERSEGAEVVMRAVFNDAIKAAVLPERFNRAVLPDLKRVTPLGQVIADNLDYSDTQSIIAENSALFDRLSEICGFDPRKTERRKPSRDHDETAVRDRIFDALVNVTLDQALRIRRMKEALERMSKGETLVPGSFGPVSRT